MDFRYNRSGDATYNEKGVRGELTGGSTGGADGCMSFEDGDNKGLAKCVQKFEIDKVYQTYCEKISLADYLVIAAEAIMAETSVKPLGYNPEKRYEMNEESPATPLAKIFRDSFKFGRKTNETCDPKKMAHRMPNPEHGCSAKNGLEWIFNENIYKNSGAAWSYTAAISGTHTLGKASKENSGYDGWWSD